MPRLVLLLCLLLAACDRSGPAGLPTSYPPLAHHAMIVSIDGCRPDVLLRANHPNIQKLMDTGCFTFWARTTAMSITLPSHTSMLTGVTPEVHGITWNNDVPGIYPNVPTIFEIAKANGLSTALIAGKAKFKTLARPGSVDWAFIQDNISDFDIAGNAASIIREHKPNVTFVHLAITDFAGHGFIDNQRHEDEGWGSPTQILAVEWADTAVGVLVDALKNAGIYRDTIIIITADHGGQAYSHGPNDPRSRHIPWICVGPRVRHNFDLTRSSGLTVHTEDTFATASYFLGLPISSTIDGRPIKQIITDRDLLSDTN
jgi:predicted AlkP superfamily pyrophosphatase or phosphodiesterase